MARMASCHVANAFWTKGNLANIQPANLQNSQKRHLTKSEDNGLIKLGNKITASTIVADTSAKVGTG